MFCCEVPIFTAAKLSTKIKYRHGFLFRPQHPEYQPRRHLHPFRFQTALPMVVFMLVVSPAVVVSLTLAVPAVIMLEAPTFSVPVSIVVTATFPTRSNPDRPAIRRQSPIAPVPNVAALYGIPVAVHPRVAGSGCSRSRIHARRRRSANSDSDGYLSFKGGRASQKHRGKQRCANKLSHVLSSFKNVFLLPLMEHC